MVYAISTETISFEVLAVAISVCLNNSESFAMPSLPKCTYYIVQFKHCWPLTRKAVKTGTCNSKKLKDFTIKSSTNQRFINDTVEIGRTTQKMSNPISQTPIQTVRKIVDLNGFLPYN